MKQHRSNSQVEDRRQWFMDRVTVTESGCWEWNLSRMARGYGQCCLFGHVDGAHRVAYKVFIGPIPRGMRVLHECDNPPCCNPEHLVAGTQSKNQRDMVNRGRSRNQYTR